MSREYQPHELRVIEEQDALAYKVKALTLFLSSQRYEGLPDEDRRLLREQLGHMVDYLNVLAKRIVRFQ